MNLIQQLGYLVIESNQRQAWEDFAQRFLGMVVAPCPVNPTNLKIRMDEHAWRFIVQPGPSEDLMALGFLVDDEAALGQIEEHLVNKGVEVRHATGQELAERDVDAMLWLRDPEGLRIEVACGPRMFTSPPPNAVIPGGFVTGDMGFGHVALCAADLPLCEAFYRDVLGMRLTDYINQDIQGMNIRFTFMHVNPRHHSVALAGLPSSTRLNHMEVQVRDIDTVGRAVQRARDLDIPIYMNLGRHPNDRMFSLYVNTPSAFAFEIGAGGLEIRGETAWQVRTHDGISEWGHLE